MPDMTLEQIEEFERRLKELSSPIETFHPPLWDHVTWAWFQSDGKQDAESCERFLHAIPQLLTSARREVAAREIVAKWRREAIEYPQGHHGAAYAAAAVELCANELESLLHGLGIEQLAKGKR